MDLVKIRKKAKAAKKSPAKKKQVKKVEPEFSATVAVDDEIESPSLHTEMDPVAEERPVVPLSADLQLSTAAPAPAEVDPLEALFSFRVEGTLATEELYLKALMGDEETTDNDQQQWLTFSLGEEEYALELGVVNEIIKTREVTAIPRVPDFIRGIISLRGIIVPVFDLRGRLKIGTIEPGPLTRIVVCQKDGKLAGLLVDSINQVVTVQSNNVEPPPTVLSGLDRDFVEGVGRVDGKMLILLHLSNVINAELT
jgi:purine-binding chemotaxis protein CheW